MAVALQVWERSWYRSQLVERKLVTVGLTRLDGHPLSGVRPGRRSDHGGYGEEEARPRRAFAPEFMAKIVKPRQRATAQQGQVAKDLDLTETAVTEWVEQAGAMPAVPPAVA